MSYFSDLWDQEVKPQALACFVPEIVSLLMKPESYVPNEEEKAKFIEWQRQYRDIIGQYFISQMCCQVDHDLADDREWKAKIAVMNMYSTLSSESYWQNVFRGKQESEEAQKLLTLRNGLQKLI